MYQQAFAGSNPTDEFNRYGTDLTMRIFTEHIPIPFLDDGYRHRDIAANEAPIHDVASGYFGSAHAISLDRSCCSSSS